MLGIADVAHTIRNIPTELPRKKRTNPHFSGMMAMAYTAPVGA